MFIKLIDEFNSIKESWKISRPDQKFNVDDILKMDLPVNEFAQMHLHIKSNILIREIFSSKNNHIMWAQTSRVQDILNFETCNSINDKEEIEKIRLQMINDAKSGIRQDDYRLKLPIFSMTEYSIVISLRNLVKICEYFLYLYNETKLFCFLEANMKITSFFENVLDLNFLDFKQFFKEYKFTKILCENFSEYETVQKIGNIITISTKLPLYLRAQLVRHRGVEVVDDLFLKMHTPNFEKQTIGSLELGIQVFGQVEAFQEILSKRACWIAQYNIWSDLLNKISAVVPEIKLPCSGGSCPFNEDAMQRYNGKDPNPPCPIHCKMNNLNVTLEQREKMYSMIKSDNRNTLIWGDFVRSTNLEK